MRRFGHLIMRLIGGLVWFWLALTTTAIVAQFSATQDIVLQADQQDEITTLYLFDPESGLRTAFDEVHLFGSEAGWSPAGQFVYVVDNDEEALRKLRLWDMEAGQMHWLSEALYPNECALPLWWSPDDRFLMFLEVNTDDARILSLWDSRTRQVEEIPGPGRYYNDQIDVRWSPDSRHLVISNVSYTPFDPPRHTVILYDAHNHHIVELPVAGITSETVWSGDGRFLAFETRNDETGKFDVYVYDTVAETTVDVSEDTQDENLWTWSPESNQLVIEAFDPARGNRLLLLDAENVPSPIISQENDDVRSVSWSPDGKYVALHLQQDNASQFVVWNIDSRMPVYTQSFEAIVEMRHVTWSADGRYVLMVAQGPEDLNYAQTLNIVDAREGQITGTLEAQSINLPMAWSTTGHHLAYLTNPNGSKGEESTLMVVNAADGTVQKVSEKVFTNYYFSLPFRWSESGRFLSFTNAQGLAVFDVTEGQLHELGEGLYFNWLDGEQYAVFSSSRSGDHALYRFNPANDVIERADAHLERLYSGGGVRRSERGNLGLSYCGVG